MSYTTTTDQIVQQSRLSGDRRAILCPSLAEVEDRAAVEAALLAALAPGCHIEDGELDQDGSEILGLDRAAGPWVQAGTAALRIGWQRGTEAERQLTEAGWRAARRMIPAGYRYHLAGARDAEAEGLIEWGRIEGWLILWLDPSLPVDLLPEPSIWRQELRREAERVAWEQGQEAQAEAARDLDLSQPVPDPKATPGLARRWLRLACWRLIGCRVTARGDSGQRELARLCHIADTTVRRWLSEDPSQHRQIPWVQLDWLRRYLLDEGL